MQALRRLSLPDRLAALAGLAAAVASIAGFVPGMYRDTAYTIAGAHGQDVANLLGVAVLWIALLAAAGDSLRGRLVAVGALGYLLYSYTAFAYEMVVNPVSVLYFAVVGCAVWALAGGFVPPANAAMAAVIGERVPRRVTGVLFVGTALLFASLWLGQIASAVSSGKPVPDLVKAGWPTSPYYTNDLAVVLPLLLVAGIQVFRGAASGPRLAVPLLVFALLMDLSIFATLVSGAAAGEATLEPGIGAVFVVHAGICGALAAIAVLPGRPARLSSGAFVAGQ